MRSPRPEISGRRGEVAWERIEANVRVRRRAWADDAGEVLDGDGILGDVQVPGASVSCTARPVDMSSASAQRGTRMHEPSRITGSPWCPFDASY